MRYKSASILIFLYISLILVACSEQTSSRATQPTTTQLSTAASTTVVKALTTPTTAIQLLATTPTPSPSTISIVDTLPTDQPWLWLPPYSDEFDSGRLFAVLSSDQLYELRSPVISVLARAGKLPLLITATNKEYALVDPSSWSSIPLQIATSQQPDSFILAPDGQSLAFRTTATDHSGQSFLYTAQVSIGATERVTDIKNALAQLNLSDIVEPNIPIAWFGSTLHVYVQSSATSYFWSLNTNEPSVTPRLDLTVGQTDVWMPSPTGSHLLWTYANQPSQLHAWGTNSDYVLERGTQAVTFTSDDTHLALVRAQSWQTATCCELLIYDIRQEAPTLQQRIALASSTYPNERPVQIHWSEDEQSIVVVFQQAVSSNRIVIIPLDGSPQIELSTSKVSYIRLVKDRLFTVEQSTLRIYKLNDRGQIQRTVSLPNTIISNYQIALLP